LYIILYRGTKTKPGVTEPILQRAMDYLSANEAPEGPDIDDLRREAGPGGCEIWLVPSGAPPPKPTATVVQAGAG